MSRGRGGGGVLFPTRKFRHVCVCGYLGMWNGCVGCVGASLNNGFVGSIAANPSPNWPRLFHVIGIQASDLETLRIPPTGGHNPGF